jgi:hypothetical protein
MVVGVMGKRVNASYTHHLLSTTHLFGWRDDRWISLSLTPFQVRVFAT